MGRRGGVAPFGSGCADPPNTSTRHEVRACRQAPLGSLTQPSMAGAVKAVPQSEEEG